MLLEAGPPSAFSQLSIPVQQAGQALQPVRVLLPLQETVQQGRSTRQHLPPEAQAYLGE